MGNSITLHKLNYEDMQQVCSKKSDYIIINTLPENEQDYLILNTIPSNAEETTINYYINNNKEIKIIIYGKNSNDNSIYEKGKQLISLGFINVYIYPGGLFEWSILQELYDIENFPTNKKNSDCLQHKPRQVLNIQYITN